MQSKCEVVGWVLIDPERTELLVREANGQVHSQKTNAEHSNGECAIQTGAFRRGERIIDPVTLETVGYEMHRLQNPYASI